MKYISFASQKGNYQQSQENQKVKEDTKSGVTREYTSNETNQIFETNLNNYRIVYDKTFIQSGKYRSYIVIEYVLDS